MLLTPLRFIHAGFGNILCANRIEAVLVPGSANAKRLIKAVKDENRFYDLTAGRPAKAYVLLDDGKLFACGLKPRTIVARVEALDTEENNEGENENENNESISPPVDA